MTIFIDYINNICFITSPKCGTQSLSKFLRLPLNIEYSSTEVKHVLKDPEFKKIIIIRDIFDRFFSGFYEDLKNNDCYNSLNISFFEYIKLIYYCHDNCIKNVWNINVYYPDMDKVIEWGNCSGQRLPITNNSGKLSGHIVHQKTHIKKYVDLIDKHDKNVEVIDINDLCKFTLVHENSKAYSVTKEGKEIKKIDDKLNYDSLLCDIKKSNIFPDKTYMINKKITNILNHIYTEDNEYIEYVKNMFIPLKIIENNTK